MEIGRVMKRFSPFKSDYARSITPDTVNADELTRIAAHILSKSILDAQDFKRHRDVLYGLITRSPLILKNFSELLLVEESTFQNNAAGNSFLADMMKVWSSCDIKADTTDLGITGGIVLTNGLNFLTDRCYRFYWDDYRFAVVKVGPMTRPMTPTSHEVMAQDMACYAIICQNEGLVPILEVKVFGTEIESCGRCIEGIISACNKPLLDRHVQLEAVMWKFDFGLLSPAAVAQRTITAIYRTVAPAVPAILFHSGPIYEHVKSQEQQLPWKIVGVVTLEHILTPTA